MRFSATSANRSPGSPIARTRYNLVISASKVSRPSLPGSAFSSEKKLGSSSSSPCPVSATMARSTAATSAGSLEDRHRAEPPVSDPVRRAEDAVHAPGRLHPLRPAPGQNRLTLAVLVQLARADPLRQPSDHLVLIAAREHPEPQRLTDLRPVPLHTAAHHLEPAHPARIQAELTAHVVDRSRRDLAGMPRKAALDLEETSPSTLSSTASPRACWPTAPGRRRPASTTRPDHPVPTHGARHDPGRARFQHRPPTNAASIRWPASPRRQHTTRRSAIRRWVRDEAPIMVCIDLDETGHIGTVVNVVLGTDHDNVALARDYRGQFLVYDEAMQRIETDEETEGHAIKIA